MSGAARRSPLDRASASPSPPSNGGDFLLQLLRRPPRSSPSTPSLPLDDPAVAAVGPSHSFSPPDSTGFSPPRQLPPWLFIPAQRHPNPPSRYAPPGFGHPAPPPAAPRAPHNPDLPQFSHPRDQHIPQRNGDARRGPSKEPPPARPAVLQFGSFHVGANIGASSGVRENDGSSEVRRFPGNPRAGNFAREDCAGSMNPDKRGTGLDAEFGRDGKEYYREREGNRSVAAHYSKSGTLRVDNVVEELDFDVDVKGLAEGLLSDDDEEETEGGGSRSSLEVKHASRSKAVNEEDLLIEQVAESLILKEEHGERNVSRKMHGSRGKDHRFDTSRGHNVSSQRVRYRRAAVPCRRDINSLSPYFLYIYKSLIPEEEEKAKQRQLLLSLEKLVNKEWSSASLHLYGSCANSFGVSKSDIDICLAIDDSETSKSDILLKLADILQSDNLQNVQALTHARVPIVKLMDPVSGISCDICINNLLAVVNTKLLRDYAQIDERLRQLAFLVKHWAKSRGVNETYQGTLSSYAYVLMCIHFLQSRRPAILPCLQEMGATYAVTVERVKCVFFDQVEKLHGFGSRNKESISELLWAFFKYWAYCHDYANDVISIRVGGIISKHSKDWTRRVGNDRHLICIEDPFETSHDLGRVVDKFSIKILREEFERAATILQFDPNPSATLFEPYVRESHPS